jgi:multimeric flavodoxin WrbA
MSNVVAIVSSPREKGNSGTAVNAILDGAMGLSTNIIQYYNLNSIRSFNGCDACGQCAEQKKCVLQDGLTGILNSLEKADVVIFSTPVYFGGPSSQFKTLLDRMYSFYVQGEGSPVRGKKAITVMSGSAPEEVIAQASAHLSGNLKALGFEILDEVIFSDMGGQKCAKDDREFLDRMRGIGLHFRNT